MTKKIKFTPAEVIEARNAIYSMTSDQLLSKGYIDLSAVLADVHPKQYTYEVMLEQNGENRIKVIKEIRAELQTTLAQAKAYTDQTPSVLVRGYTYAEARQFQRSLQDAGATVSIRKVAS